MSTEETGSVQEGGQEQQGEQRRIQVRDTGITTQYANFFTVTGGVDAILISFANQFSRDVVQLESKIVLSPRNAKRMAISLGQVIRAYEQQHGEIEIGTPAAAAAVDQQQPPPPQ